MPNLLLGIFRHSKKRNLTLKAFLYLSISSLFWLFALIIKSRLLEFIALMFLAGTFLPMPADTYVLYATEYFDPLSIGIIGGIVNALAVIFEKYWLRQLMDFGYFEKFSIFFAKTKFTKYMHRYMFWSLVISAFSILPFEPFRLVAVIKDYNNFKYWLATLIGRGLRYYLLAIIGRQFIQYDLLSFVLVLSLSGFAWGIFKMIKNKK